MNEDMLYVNLEFELERQRLLALKPRNGGITQCGCGADIPQGSLCSSCWAKLNKEAI